MISYFSLRKGKIMGSLESCIEAALYGYIHYYNTVMSLGLLLITATISLKEVVVFGLLTIWTCIDSRFSILFSLIGLFFQPVCAFCFLLESIFVYLVSHYFFYLIPNREELRTLLLSISLQTRELRFSNIRIAYNRGFVLLCTKRGLFVGDACVSFCCVCLEEERRGIKTECGHTICIDDAIKWFSISNTCPVCRKHL